jgi:hypothetical protein
MVDDAGVAVLLDQDHFVGEFLAVDVDPLGWSPGFGG